MPGRVFPKKEGTDGTSPQAKVTQPHTQDNKDEKMAPPVAAEGTPPRAKGTQPQTQGNKDEPMANALAAIVAADATHQKEAVKDLVADVEHHCSALIDLAQHALDHAQIGHIRKGMKLVGAYWRNAEVCAYWRERANIKETQERKRMIEYASYCCAKVEFLEETQERKRMLEYASYCAKVEFLETSLAEWILSVE